jgi:hypothetical protein
MVTNMLRMHFSIIINASKEKVWDTMLGEGTYRKWTEGFMPGSHYVGDWSQGSKMLFLAPGENGESGMVSRIKENRPHEYISIEHIGVVQDGKEDISSEAAKLWAGGYEDYRFREVEGGTEVLVDMFGKEAMDEFRDMFESTWPKALQKLKEIAEVREKVTTRKRTRPRISVTRRRRK